MDQIRLVIVDDQKLFRQNLKTVIELRIPEAKVVGIAGDGQEALKIIKITQPNLVLMDIRMPGMDGVECIRQLRREENNVQIIVLTTFADDEYVFEALKYGAVGYLLKDIEPEELTKAIIQVQEGGKLLSPQVTNKLVEEVIRRRSLDKDVNINNYLTRLTHREIEVLRHIALGEDNHEIATNLYISEGTVKNYVSNMY